MYCKISYIKNMWYEGADQNSLVIIKKKTKKKNWYQIKKKYLDLFSILINTKKKII